MSIEVVRLIDSRRESPIGKAFGGLLVLHMEGPRSATSITVRLNRGGPAQPGSPETTHQSVTLSPPSETTELRFDLSSSPSHSVTVYNQHYKITLMQIGSDQGAPWYEFQITTVE